MEFRNISVRNKITIPVATIVFLGIIATVIVTVFATRKIVIDEAKNTAMSCFRDTTLNALTTLMSAIGGGERQRCKKSFSRTDVSHR